MHQPFSGPRSPVSVSKYLLPREVQVAAVRQHPAVLVIPGAQACSGLALGVVWTWALAATTPQLIAIWSAVSLLVLYCLRAVARWLTDFLVVTSERLLKVSGGLYRSTEMTPLGDLTDMTFARTFSGRLLGYGTFVKESGRRQVIQAFVPYSEQLYLLICGMLFPASADEEDDESEPAEALADEL